MSEITESWSWSIFQRILFHYDIYIWNLYLWKQSKSFCVLQMKLYDILVLTIQTHLQFNSLSMYTCSCLSSKYTCLSLSLSLNFFFFVFLFQSKWKVLQIFLPKFLPDKSWWKTHMLISSAYYPVISTKLDI